MTKEQEAIENEARWMARQPATNCSRCGAFVSAGCSHTGGPKDPRDQTEILDVVMVEEDGGEDTLAGHLHDGSKVVYNEGETIAWVVAWDAAELSRQDMVRGLVEFGKDAIQFLDAEAGYFK